jgi:hypothetical protein
VGHELRPRSDKSLTVLEITRHLRAEFAFVAVDVEEGTRAVQAAAEWIEARPASFFNHRIENIARRRAGLLERAKVLRALAPGLAAGFTIGEDANGETLHFVFIPDRAIMFGYSGSEEERRLRPLIDRCARALDCEVLLF